MSRGHIFTRERGGGDRGRGSYIDEGAHHIPSEVCFALFLFGIGVTESARLGNVSKPSRDVLLSYIKQKCHNFHVNK